MKFKELIKKIQKPKKKKIHALNDPYNPNLYIPRRSPFSGQPSNMEEGVIKDTLAKVKSAPGVKQGIAAANAAGKKAFKLRKFGPLRSKKNPFKSGSTTITKKSGDASKFHGGQFAALAVSPVAPYGVAGAALAGPVGYIPGKMLHVGHMAHAAHAAARTMKIKNWAKARIGKKGNRE